MTLPTQFNTSINFWLRGQFSITKSFAYPTQYKLFSSDYALYWYDYQAGYDTIFAEFGANYSRQLNIAECRGAATALGKDWGVMVTWTYRQPPYIESGPELYNDMVLAYQNGAKYILIFDSNEGYSQSILQQGQLDAMKQFWQYVQNNPRTISPVSDRTAYVLPQDYAYGFRGPNDRIWGLWGPDAITTDISMNVSLLLQKYGENLDIVYPDGPKNIQSLGYQNVYYWNETKPISNGTSPISSEAPTVQPTSNNQSGFSISEVYVFSSSVAAIVLVAVFMFFRLRRTEKSEKAFVS